ncbi:hypothetical protein ACFL5Q_06245 [Planctomycetota bacterium]
MFRALNLSLSLLVVVIVTGLNGPLGQAAESETTIKYKYKVMYRLSSDEEWIEAAKAGSPFDTEAEAVKVAKMLFKKLKESASLGAPEVTVKKLTIKTTRRNVPAEDLEKTLPPEQKSPPSPPGNERPIPDRSAPPDTDRREGDRTGAIRETDPGQSYPERIIVPLRPPTHSHKDGQPIQGSGQMGGGGTISDLGEDTSSGDSSGGSGERARVVVEEDGPKDGVVSVRDNDGKRYRTPDDTGGSGNRVEGQAPDTSVAGADGSSVRSGGTLDDALDGIVREAEQMQAARNSGSRRPGGVRYGGSSSGARPGSYSGRRPPSFTPNFFDSLYGADPADSRPARRIRVFTANGEKISETWYDKDKMRIGGSSRPEVLERAEAELESLRDAEESPEYSGDGKSITFKDLEEEGANLRAERADLQRRKSGLYAEMSSINNEVNRLNGISSDLAREDRSLRSRRRSLNSQEVELNSTLGTWKSGYRYLTISSSRPYAVLGYTGGTSTESFYERQGMGAGRFSFKGSWGEPPGLSLMTGRLKDGVLSVDISHRKFMEPGNEVDSERLTFTKEGIDFSALDRKRLNDSRDQVREDEFRLERRKRQFDTDLAAMQKKRRQWEAKQSMYGHDWSRHEEGTSTFNRKIQEFKQRAAKR